MSAQNSSNLPDRKLLSIVIPVYNELDTWRELLKRVESTDAAGMRKQILLIDDGSSDGTRDQLSEFAAEVDQSDNIQYKVVLHEANKGKGAALRTGFAEADGDIVIIQDADLEYDPDDYSRLVVEILEDRGDVVYGSRFSHGRPESIYAANYLANRFLEQDRFGFEPEITAKVARLGIRLCEVPISYVGRSHKEGKKIGWRDGLKTIWCILKYGFG